MTYRTLALSALVVVSVLQLVGTRADAQEGPTGEIVALRTRIAQAVKQKDRATLERVLADDFTHTHAVGRMDDREQRIRSLVSGEATVDSVEPDEMRIRFYGPERTTAIAVGQSAVGDYEYRFTVVYFKGPGGWRAAASHASEVQ